MSKRMIAALCVVVASNAATAQEMVVDLLWQSAASSPFELAKEISELYVSLYNSENLKVREVGLGERLVETALRDEGVFFGDHFPIILDALLCDLNAAICDRRRAPVGPDVLDDATAHVGGFAPSYGRWTATAKSVLVVPDYQFAPETTLMRLPVPTGWTPADFSAAEELDCSAWKMPCDELVARFNPRLIAGRSRDMTATLPQLQFSTELSVAIDGRTKHEATFSGIERISEPGNILAPTFSVSDTFKQRANDASNTDLIFESIGENIAPVGWLQQYSAHETEIEPEPSNPVIASADSPGSEAQPANARLGEMATSEVMVLMRAINHPYAFNKELPETHRAPVTVAIIDYGITQGHCDWPQARLSGGQVLPVIADETCDKLNDTPLSDDDHVTLVGGIIAAQGNGHGAVGINPFAELMFMTLNLTDAPAAQISQLSTTLFSEEVLQAEIINLSAGFERPNALGSLNRLETALAVSQSTALIVVAAGNQRKNLRDDCIVMPACMNKLENVVTVVGISSDEADPTVWLSAVSGSNTHPDFDLGAVAEDVYSTVSGNRYGNHSGTSFAAPQVSAAASLILAAAKRNWAAQLDGARIPPKFIKDRLIYTADFKPQLSGKMRSGRLNVGRAIEVARDQYLLKDGRLIMGQTEMAPHSFACRTPVETERIQNFWNLRRMSYLPEQGRYVLFKHTSERFGDRFAPLDEFHGCVLETISPLVRVRVDLDTTVEFTFGEILDYTSLFIETLEPS